ncbi:MAG: NAD(P)-dependent oxidoreductase [Caldilineaceae bacterium]|nr:NAD(P)-dependent oxidoreductase [Caldilineaceae bacterium]MDE0340320.1 NAD(P)-dependent oxidoreductase [Caldilineaceae bacterium]
MTKRILVTGMSGLIGGAVRQHLESRYNLTALNRSLVPGVRTVQADIADFDSILPAFEGQDTVVHLAASARGSDPWERVRDPNLIGVYNVFEAARRAGVSRVIFASSGSTISGWEQVQPYRALVNGDYENVLPPWPMITHETPVRPAGVYGATKVWGEALARQFTDSSELSIICLRIGLVNEEDRPTDSRQFSVWCSQRDISQMVERCIIAPSELKFDIFYALSRNKWGYRDLSHAREVVGFEPSDEAEAFR